MGNWIISPSEGVVNNNDGSFVIPCSMSNVDYNITYVNNEGCSSNTVTYTYVTSGDCQGDCPVSGSIINPQIVAVEGGTQVPIMHVLKNSTYTGYTITPTSSSSMYVSNVNQGAHLHDNWYLVLADVTSNESSSSGRTLSFDIEMSGTTTPSTGCSYTDVPVTQEGAGSCVALNITTSSVTFNSSGGSINVGTISGSHTVTKTSDSPSWVTVNTSSNNISISASTTTETRNGVVTFKVDDETCDGQTITVSQTVPVPAITYYSPSKVNVALSAFTPAATAETFADGVGKIEFSANVTAIGQKAFSGKTAMTGIDIPNSITSIGDSAFRNCTGLTSITIPSGVTTIGDSTFRDCSGLTSVTIPDSVTSISKQAFYQCTSLTSCTIGSGVTTIGDSAFQYCSGLRSCTIPSGVTTIGDSTFRNCSGLTSCTIGSGVTTIGDSAFENCTGLTSITIPSGVTTISKNLLYNCTSLSSVTLESETLQLKQYSISNCPNLRKIEMISVTACPSDYQYALEKSADCPIYVPEGHLDKFWNSSTFSYKDRVIAHVGNDCVVYKSSSKLTGDSLKNAYSSEYKSSSTKLSISLHTFNSSTKIGKITYNNTVRSFHDGAFETRAIDYIVLPENIKRIGQTVFQSSNLISIYFPDSLVGLCNSATDWGCDILHNCTKLKKVVAGSGLTQIGYSCFSCADEASSLTGITFYSTTPPRLDHGNTFGHTIHASIYVPCGQVSTYKSANIWKNSDIKDKIKAIPPCTS